MKTLKTNLKKIPFLKSIYQKIKPANKLAIAYWIHKYIPNESIQVVQIGSNDGISGDTLNKLIQKNKLWHALFVEPVPQLFQLLEKNYGSSTRFKFENSGINETGENQIFYMIGDEAYHSIPELSEEYKQIGSFSRAHVEKLANNELQKYIIELDVSCVSLNELLVKHEISTIELLQIDAEGYDWKILSQLNLHTYHPIIILFESVNLDDDEKKEALVYLTKKYHVFSMGINYLCLRKDKLTQADLKTLSRIDKLNSNKTEN